MSKRAIYLDHSATTPTDPRVLEAMLPYFNESYGNPASSHGFGRKADRAVEDAREIIASIFNGKPSEVIFTSGGSESDNLAVRGAAWDARRRGKGLHIVTTPLEHDAVGKTAKQLADVAGFEMTVLPVDHVGLVDVEDFAAACGENTTLASIMYANNEVGTIQPVAQLAAFAKERGILFHTDAVQAAGQLTLDVKALGVDMMSVSAHKFYGPKGVGALYVHDGIELVPSQSGGSHENGRRAGTLNTPGIVGLARAMQLGYDELEQHTRHYQAMRDRLIGGVLANVPDARLSGHPERRLPTHASFIFNDINSDMLLMHLDMKGVAGSSGSACKTGNPEPSNVLLALGYSREEALSSLRLTVGRSTTADDIDYTVSAIAEAVEKIQQLGLGVH